MKIGIDIGGSHIASGIVDNNGKLIDKVATDISSAHIKNEKQAKKVILDIIDDEIGNLLQKNGLSKKDISAIGLAVPGSPSKTAIINTVNLHIKKFEIAKILEEKYAVTVKLRNDGKCAGFAEKKYGALKQYDDCVFLCIGTGVGSAVFLNGKLLQPKLYPGFEFGHMIINKKRK